MLETAARSATNRAGVSFSLRDESKVSISEIEKNNNSPEIGYFGLGGTMDSARAAQSIDP